MTKNSILLVDGDPNLLKSTRQFLKEYYTVYAVSNGGDALEFFRKKRVDLLLMDYRMPELSGYEVLKKLRAQPETAELPVIYLVSEQLRVESLEGLDLGRIDYMTKPLSMDALLKRVNRRIAEMNAEKDAPDEPHTRALPRDRMTGLLKRESFEISVEACLRRGAVGALLILNLDEFKFVNDTFGLLEGDNLLIAFSQVLTESLPGETPVARLGGDAFAAFLPDVADRAAIAQSAEAVIGRAKQRLWVPDRSRILTPSIGISLFPDNGATFDDLFGHAERALLYVKNHGKNGYRLYDSIDDRQEESKGRHYCTFTPQHLLLKKRNGEERQLWVKFGEYRLIWHGLQALRRTQAVRCASVLFSFRSREGLVVDDERIEQLGSAASQYFRRIQLPGFFAWYSVNQLLYMTMTPEEIEEVIRDFQAAFAEQLSDNVEISIDTLTGDDA